MKDIHVKNNGDTYTPMEANLFFPEVVSKMSISENSPRNILAEITFIKNKEGLPLKETLYLLKEEYERVEQKEKTQQIELDQKRRLHFIKVFTTLIKKVKRLKVLKQQNAHLYKGFGVDQLTDE